MKKLLFAVILTACLIRVFGQEQTSDNYLDLNKPERLEWFRELGFGMFIHFSFDSQLGVVISHSMVGASDDYLHRYIHELPKSFNPANFAPGEIATLARLAGMKYIVFTTKHHSGFCMWNTKTTTFNIMNTLYGKDLLAEYVEATRQAGLAVGFYYSPEDFHFLYKNNQQVRRRFPKPLSPEIMKPYLELTELQCMELMTQYGDIDIMFFDGGEGLLQEKSKQVVWELQPNVVVTRGAIKTPEQTVPGIASPDPWEACITMGTQWAWKPTNEEYKTGSRLIEILIETRAKGGNLLLNVGPKPNGEIPQEQEANLREMAAWNFINQEAIEKVYPWILTNEDNIWYTYKPAEKTLYAFLTRLPDWQRGARMEFTLRSVRASENTIASILGQSGELVEYQPSTDAHTYFEQTDEGLQISCVRAQRIYNNNKWPNPIVIKITNVLPALEPPVVLTKDPIITDSGNKLIFKGKVLKKGNAENLTAGFEFREYAGFVEELYSSEWKETKTVQIPGTDEFQIEPGLIKNNREYQVRAFVDHPKLRITGEIVRIRF